MKHWSKFMTIFSILFISFEVWSAAVNYSHHWYSAMGSDIFFAVFWAGLLLLNIKFYAQERGHEIADEYMEMLGKDAEAMINDMMAKFEIPGQAVVKSRKRRQNP